MRTSDRNVVKLHHIISKYMTKLANIDIVITVSWIIFMMAFGVYISFKSKTNTAKDFFLASNSLPWWAVGGSLIAANISAEQFIGMSGSGYVVGLAIAAYELMAAVTLIVVAKYFLPVFINKGIYTMPQFLEKRFDKRVQVGLAFFWVLLFVLVNISSVLYLGALALEQIIGVPMVLAVVVLAIYSASFSVTGGLKAVALTDVVQVVALIFGGLVASYMVLNAVSDGNGLIKGMELLVQKAPEKFDMILDKNNPQYINLPGISVLIGGMWIANLYYWGTNQYIIQRSLACKSMEEAQIGTAAAAVIKVVLPLIVVIPGIAAFVLHADISKPDEAYPWVVSNYVGPGYKGIALAALIAAIGSSVASIVNSASTIFTLDIYKPLVLKDDQYITGDDTEIPTAAQEKKLVFTGKISSLIFIIIGVALALQLGNLDQAFQYIQEYTGFISPGVLAIFILGLFWRKTSTNAAWAGVIVAIPLSVAFKFFTPQIPFIDRMGLSFLLITALMIVISLIENKGKDDAKALYYDKTIFHTSTIFNILAAIVILMVGSIYYFFW